MWFTVSAKALIDPSRDGFNFRQFRHGSSVFIVAESGRRLAATRLRYMIWSWTMLRRRASMVSNIPRTPPQTFDLSINRLSHAGKSAPPEIDWSPCEPRQQWY
jgi:hypothetical protein